MTAELAMAALFFLGAREPGPRADISPPRVAQVQPAAPPQGSGGSDTERILRQLDIINQRLDRLEKGRPGGNAPSAAPKPRAGVDVPDGSAACPDGSFPKLEIPAGQRALPGWGLFQFPFTGSTKNGTHQFYTAVTGAEFTYDLHPGGNGRNKPVQYLVVGGVNICEPGRYAIVLTVSAEADDILAQVKIFVNGRVVGEMGNNGRGLPIRKGDSAVVVGDAELPVGVANVNILLRNESWMLAGSLNTAAAFRSDPGLWATRFRIQLREPGALKEKDIPPTQVFHYDR